MNKILRFEPLIFLVLFLLELSLVLERFQLVSGYITVYFYHPFILLVILLSTYFILKDRDLSLFKKLFANKLFILFVVYLAFIAISILWSPSHLDGVRSIVKTLTYLSMVLAVIFLLKRFPQILKPLLLSNLVIGFSVLIFGLVQMVGWWDFNYQNIFLGTMVARPNAGFTEPDWFGIYLSIIAAITIVFAIRQKSLLNVYSILSLVFSMGVFLSSSRTASLTLGFSLVLAVVADIYKWTLKDFLSSIGRLSVLVLMSVIFSLAFVRYVLPDDFQYLADRFSTGIHLQETGVQSRIDLTNAVVSTSTKITNKQTTASTTATLKQTTASTTATLKPKDTNVTSNISDTAINNSNSQTEVSQQNEVGMFKDLLRYPKRILLGYGLGSWGYYLGQRERGVPYGGGAFNFLISIVFEVGLVGLVLFLVTFGYLILLLFKNARGYFDGIDSDIYSVIALILPLNLFLAGMFSNTYLVAFSWFFVALSVVLLNYSRGHIENWTRR